MLEITATHYRDQAIGHRLSATFDESGGTIGRADTNRLLLPDPERHISRVQAEVICQGTEYFLANRGSNPILVGDTAVASGDQVKLRDGDELVIGDYALRVAVAATEDAERTLAPTARAAAPAADALGLFGTAPPPTSTDAFADLFGAPATPPPAPPPVAPQPQAAKPEEAAPQSMIPEDFDPFAEPFRQPPAPAQATAAPSDALGLGLAPLQPEREQDIDALFGLAPSAPANPLAGTPLDERSAAPEAGASSDPFAALGLGAGRKEEAAAVPDQVPELQGFFQPPPARPEAPAGAAPSGVPPPEPERGQPAEGMFLSWESESAPGATETAKTLTQSRLAPVGAAPQPAPSEDSLLDVLGGAAREGADALGLETPAEAPAAPRAVPPPQAEPAAAPQAAQDELVRALLDGLGTPNLQLLEGLSPATMRVIGQLLREAVQGTLDLLVARAMTKREIRAEVTMIVGRGNNPLKFSPDANAALAHLLAPQARGFMAPTAAMKDAYDDLRSHQFGFMAGMQAALAGVLRRFNPETLEKRLKQRSMLDNLLPMNRKAKMWDLFAELYEDISEEAKEDFHTVFGKEFLRAYEEQVERLRDKGAAGR